MHIKKVPTIEVPFFYKLNLKKVNENSAKHYIFKKVINQQDFFSTKNQLYNLHYICTIVPSICQLSFESFSSAILASENT